MHSLEAINQTLFLWINAPDLPRWQRRLSRAGAHNLSWLFGCLLSPLKPICCLLSGHLAQGEWGIA